MNTIDGKKIAEKLIAELREEVKKMQKQLRLAIVRVGDDPVTSSYLERKKKTGEGIGISVRIFEYPTDISTDKLRKQMAVIVHEKKNTGIIVQLPLPKQISVQYILNSITPEKDVDVLSARAIGNLITGKSVVLPPVAVAVKKIFEEYDIQYQNKRIVIVGAGRLVGRPVALWLMSEDIGFSAVTEKTPDTPAVIREADIIISGVGKAGLITGDIVKNGAVVVDAGISESKGGLVGDIDFDSVSKKASFLTPVPGGVGPLAVVMLFKNLVELAKINK
ncbi:MAG: bifunctional 5,10-methylenetetrahydrofolate dehydrogenase/5,10-methenyltetrahydrofolate cyclohydrolase [Patescibacteria group bacterium]